MIFDLFSIFSNKKCTEEPNYTIPVLDIGEEQIAYRMKLNITELDGVLTVANILTDKQRKNVIKQLRKNPPERLNLFPSDILEILAHDKTVTTKFKKITIQRILNIAHGRAHTRYERERRSAIKIKKAKISFIKDIPLCETMEKYKLIYDNQIMLLDEIPIFPLCECYQCKACHLAVFTRGIVIEE